MIILWLETWLRLRFTIYDYNKGARVMVNIMIGDRVMCIYLGFRVIDRLGLK